MVVIVSGQFTGDITRPVRIQLVTWGTRGAVRDRQREMIASLAFSPSSFFIFKVPTKMPLRCGAVHLFASTILPKKKCLVEGGKGV